MSNEHLGIFEELQERRERYSKKNRALRDRILGAGPATPHGAYAELRNPFAVRVRLKNRQPYHRTHRELPSCMRRRVIWPESKFGLNVVQVVQAVVIESGLTAGEMMNASHKRYLARPRHVAMWAVDRYCPDYSLPEIGYMFNRDHTTVMYAIRETNQRLEAHCPETKTLVANVRQRLINAALVA